MKINARRDFRSFHRWGGFLTALPFLIVLLSGLLLQASLRRSDLIESIHDGSWFHDRAKLWIFLPSAGVVTILWVTGIYLLFLPYIARYKHPLRREQRRLARRDAISPRRKNEHNRNPKPEPEPVES